MLVPRIAGQFSKPRTEPFETINGTRVCSYKGDLINGAEPENREPDPNRMLMGYFNSVAVMNYIRQYCLAENHEIFTSHEAMHLSYEAALTRSKGNKNYNLSAHMVWLGERTRKLGYAHTYYLSQIDNPVGVKIGPGVNLDELIQIITLLNPKQENGKLILIPRFGVAGIKQELPRVIEAVQNSGIPHIWVLDPMHGNTYKSQTGFKTRNYSDVLQECLDGIEVLEQHNAHLGGIHIEASYEIVTECVGGECGITEDQLHQHYTTLCDPRLNRSQAIELLTSVGRAMPAKSRRKF